MRRYFIRFITLRLVTIIKKYFGMTKCVIPHPYTGINRWEQNGRVRALLHMVGEGIIFGIVYGIFWLIAGVMALRLKWLGERSEKRYDSWQDN